MASWTTWVFLVPILFNGQEVKAQDCGMAPLNTKVVGGANATEGAWPWQVSLHFRPLSFHFCGGTLINNQWVLCAAHCTTIVNASDVIVYLGRHSQELSNPNEVNRTVARIINHPNYNNSLLNNDISLLELSSPVNFTDYIKPICLASGSSNFHNSTNCWATGWGNIRYQVPLESPQILQEVEVPVIGNNQCSCQYRPVAGVNITAEMICAGKENKGICQGDSGGPLQCQQGAMWVQAGISSFGVPCATGLFPEVYARVSEFQSWITENLGGQNASFVTFNSSGVDADDSFMCNSTTNVTTTTPSSAAGVQLSLFTLILSMLQSVAITGTD